MFLTVRGDRMVMSSPVGAKEITVGGEVDGWISVDRSGLLAVLRECDDPGVRICTAPFGQVVIEDRPLHPGRPRGKD